MMRKLKCVGFSLLALVALVFVLLVSTLLFLNSKAGSDFLVARVKAKLAEISATGGVGQLDFKEGEFRLLSGFHFKSLNFTKAQEGERIVFTAQVLDAAYGFSFFPPRLELSKLRFENPRLDMEILSAQKDEPADEAAGDDGGTSLDELVLAPPVEIFLRDIEIAGLDARVRIQSKDGENLVEVKGADLTLSLEAVPRRLVSVGKFQVREPVKIRHLTRDGYLAMSVKPSFEWDVAVVHENGQWNYRLSPFQFQVQASDIEMRTGEASVRMPSAFTRLKAVLLARSQALLQLGESGIESVEVNGEGELSGFKFFEKKQIKPKASVEKHDFRVAIKLKEFIDIALNLGANGVQMPGTLLRRIDAGLETQARVSRDLNSVEASGSATIERKKLLDFSSRILRSGQNLLNAQGRLNMDVRSDLARLVKAGEGMDGLEPFTARLDYEVKPRASGELAFMLKAKVPEVKSPSLKIPLGLDLETKGSWSAAGRFSADTGLHIDARTLGARFELNSKASGDMKTQDVRAEIEMTADSKPLSGKGAKTLQGKMHIPAVFSVRNGREVSLSGEVGLENVSWSGADWSVEAVSGKIPFLEKLVWNGTKIRFDHLLKQNPFERVDFERVRPLLSGSEPLRIESLRWEDRSYGPFVGFFSLRQNLLSAHQFNFDVGLGRVYGEMFFDAHPGELQFGLLSRLTGLRINEFLPSRFLKRLPRDSGAIGGRSGLVFSLNRSSVDGRLDITEIGGPQLSAMVNIVDPDFEDEKMNRVRKLLEVGYPTSVGLSFSKGYMNMDIVLSLLGVVTRESVREIPVTSLLSKATSDLVKQAKKGPLE